MEFLLPLCRARKKQHLLTYLKRFQEARKTFQNILVDYNNISKGIGGNVRSYLEIVGVATLMYGITKVVKELQE